MVHALVLVVFLALQDPKVTELAFTAPAGTDQKAVDKAAAQIRKRIADYGYKGVVVSADTGRVRVSFAPGFTQAMLSAINRLATIRGQAYLWATLPMTDKEREQWIPGKTSPPGSSWFIEGEIKNIMDNSWKTTLDVTFERYTSQEVSNPIRLAFGKAESKKFLDRLAKDKFQRGFILIVDGKRASFRGTVAERQEFDRNQGAFFATGIMDWKPSEEVTDDILISVIAIGSPLPVELTQVK